MIVVGVDGSPEAAEALEYAAVEAARRGARLRVVSVFSVPEYWSVPVGFIPPTVPAPSWDL
jgi:nucleotide-binding universal stress UspA family protein